MSRRSSFHLFFFWEKRLNVREYLWNISGIFGENEEDENGGKRKEEKRRCFVIHFVLLVRFFLFFFVFWEGWEDFLIRDNRDNNTVDFQ